MSEQGVASSNSNPPWLRGVRAAFVFMTRLNVGGFPYSREDFVWASAHFPLVGLVVGGLGALVFTGAQSFGPSLAALLALLTTLWVTGAFHEDGLADTSDALGGAHGPKKIFEILKDSRLGTYGVSALALSLLLRSQALAALSAPLPVAPSIPMGAALLPWVHAVARLAPVALMRFLPYVSEQGAKGAAVAAGGKTAQLLGALLWTGLASAAALGLGLAPLFALLALVATLVVTLLLGKKWFRAVGGYTGDFLGATEQIVEIVLLLLAVALHTRSALWS